MAAAQPAISQSKHLWCLKDMFCSRVKIGDQKMFSYGRGVSPGTNAVIYRHTITSVMLIWEILYIFHLLKELT